MAARRVREGIPNAMKWDRNGTLTIAPLISLLDTNEYKARIVQRMESDATTWITFRNRLNDLEPACLLVNI